MYSLVQGSVLFLPSLVNAFGNIYSFDKDRVYWLKKNSATLINLQAVAEAVIV